jgi:hypothetical protein
VSVHSKLFYWLTCDNCQERIDYGDFAAMSDESDAIDAALDSDWTTDGTKHHCWNCPPLTRCDRCDKPAGDLAGERDYLCQDCWDALPEDERAS